MPFDPATIAAALGGKLTYDVLGPSAKYLGTKLKTRTQRGMKNIARVLKYAMQRKRELGITEGAVAPRVIPLVLEGAYYCEDETVAGYLGGVLCSAQSPSGRDDRAVSFLRLIEGLSSFALRAHFIVYASVALQRGVRSAAIRKYLLTGHGVTVLFDEEDLREHMAFGEGEDPVELLEHAFVALAANDLCLEGTQPVHIEKENRSIRWVHLTPRGVELFCWGIGLGQAGVAAYFEKPELPEECAHLHIPADIKLGMVRY
jgi:hypothetical protein